VPSPISMVCISRRQRRIRKEFIGSIGKMIIQPGWKMLRWKYVHFRNKLVQGHHLHNKVHGLKNLYH
jgi:nucleoside diphosphate kinase